MSPGIVVGAIVTFKIRYRWALFGTIFSSIIGAIIVPASVMLIWKLLLTQISLVGAGMGIAGFMIISELVSVPIGLMTGAILSGMLLVVQHRLSIRSINFSSANWIVATIISTLTGSFICLAFALVSPLLMYFFSLFGSAINILPIQHSYKDIIVTICTLITVVCGSGIAGLISAINGIKIAKFLI